MPPKKTATATAKAASKNTAVATRKTTRVIKTTVTPVEPPEPKKKAARATKKADTTTDTEGDSPKVNGVSKAKGKTATTKKATAAPAKATASKVTKAPAKAPAKKAPAKKAVSARRSKEQSSPDTDIEAPAVNGDAEMTDEEEVVKVAPTAAKSKKRKAEDDIDSIKPAKTAKAERPIKAATKPKAALKPKAAPIKRPAKPRPVVNETPTKRLHVYVFGAGENAELGLGTAKGTTNVKRPRLHPMLEQVGIVQVATGGMHVLALSHDNKIYTWGVNDQYALGRVTDWEGGLRDMDEEAESSDSEPEDDNGLNPREATPTAIPSDAFPEGTKFVKVAAGDSCSFAVTDTGDVWGWGTFRNDQGIFGFTPDTLIQKTPLQIQGLKNIVDITTGANHVLALNKAGTCFAWGVGSHHELGRRLVERTAKEGGLIPRECMKKVKYIGCGSYHSFAVDMKDKVWAWGLNSCGQTGVPGKEAILETGDESQIDTPTLVPSLSGKGIIQIEGGGQHSIAVTKDQQCLVWGKGDGGQLGIKFEDLPKEELIHDARGQPRILKTPTALPNLNITYAASGPDHNIVITAEGKAYSWGFSSTYQTGLGVDNSDRFEPEMIDNNAIRDVKLNWAGCGGQYSIVTAYAAPAQVNGVPNGTAPAVNGTS